MMELKTQKEILGDVLPRCLDIGKADVSLFSEDLKQEVINWIKKFKAMKYGEHFCFNCMSVYGGGNSGSQYCCRGEDGELNFLDQQTGGAGGAVSVLMKFHNITVEDLK